MSEVGSRHVFCLLPLSRCNCQKSEASDEFRCTRWNPLLETLRLDTNCVGKSVRRLDRLLAAKQLDPLSLPPQDPLSLRPDPLSVPPPYPLYFVPGGCGGVWVFTQYPWLRILDLRSNHIEDVDDISVAAIAECCPLLEVLDLRDNPVLASSRNSCFFIEEPKLQFLFLKNRKSGSCF